MTCSCDFCSNLACLKGVISRLIHRSHHPLTRSRHRRAVASNWPSALVASTAAAEAALADSVASVLAFHEEFFVRHDRLLPMRLPSMLHLGLIVRDGHHQKRRA